MTSRKGIIRRIRENSIILTTMSSEITSPVTIFDIPEISQLNLTETSSSMDELISISPETTTFIPDTSSPDPTLLPPYRELSLAYTLSESIVSLLAIFGNALVVYIFCKNRSLRRYRNYYIVALAIADFLVGLLGIPFAILASVGLPRNLYGCLFTVSILMVLCTVSILCLVAVSIDRYWATTNPFAYYRNMTTTTAVSIILFCWVAGAIIGFLPLFGWYNNEGWLRHPSEYCFFTDVMDYSYLVFLYFATIVFPALLMIGFYGYIYHVVLIKIRQKGTLAPQHLRRFSEQSRTGSLSCENRSATQVLRIMVSEKRREAKAAKKLGIIVLFFMLCWMPLYTINCIQAFYSDFHVPIELVNFTIILSHANSALNPFLYAYHLKEFRLAMKHALLSLCGKMFCGLVNANPEMENPLGPMSRSLTMPSLGHVTTIPNPTGKVSIKFRKISRPEDAQISPTNDINSMIPTVVTTPSKDNLLLRAGGTDKSLTSLSIPSDSSNQLLEIPLQQVTPTSICSFAKNSPKNVHSNGGRKQKFNGPMIYTPSTPISPSSPTEETNLDETAHDNQDNCNGNTKEAHLSDVCISVSQEHSESCATTTTSTQSLIDNIKVDIQKETANGAVNKGESCKNRTSHANNSDGSERERKNSVRKQIEKDDNTLVKHVEGKESEAVERNKIYEKVPSHALNSPQQSADTNSNEQCSSGSSHNNDNVEVVIANGKNDTGSPPKNQHEKLNQNCIEKEARSNSVRLEG